MQFLKTLFWVVSPSSSRMLASRNWHDVTLNLWGDIQVDIKMPVLIAVMFLLGLLPTYLIHRARLWRAASRLDSFERQQAACAVPASRSAERRRRPHEPDLRRHRHARAWSARGRLPSRSRPTPAA